MELITSGIIFSAIILLIGALWRSFTLDSNNKNSTIHLMGQKKILTQDGMVVKNTPKDQPIFLIGDSKVIRK